MANMFAQKNFTSRATIRYYALELVLKRLARSARVLHTTVQMPCIGTGLGRAPYDLVMELIKRTLSAKGVPVIICKWNPNKEAELPEKIGAVQPVKVNLEEINSQ